MSERIEFPLNDGMYFKQAQEHLSNKKYRQALDAINNVKENTPPISYLHALILFYLEEYEEALDIANRYKEYYLSTDEYAISYALLLIKNKLFVEAEAIILQHLNESIADTIWHSNWMILQKELEEERTLYNNDILKHQNEIRLGLLEIESYSSLKQTTLIKQAHLLDLTDLQVVAQSIFDSYNLSPLNQRAFLEILINKKDTQEYRFNWLNHQKKIKPSEMNTFEETPIISQIEEIILFELEDTPTLIEPMYLEILNDLLILYPFIEEVITDVNYWVNLYLSQLEVDESCSQKILPESKQEEEMLRWMKSISQFTKRI